MKTSLIFQIILGFLLSISTLTNAQTLKEVASIDLPGPVGKRFDYLKINYKDHYLLLAHLGADQLYVIDLKTSKPIKTIHNTPGIEGIEYVADLDKVYTANWGDKTIGIIDFKQMKVIKKLPARAKPDGLAYAPPFHKLYVSDERGKVLIIVDIQKDSIVKTLEFDGETGNTQYDPIAKKVYLNLQDQNLIAVINPATDTVEEKIPVGKCKGNHGMALDPENHLVFLACEENNLLSVFNLSTRRSVANIPLPNGVDVIAFDPGLKRIYAACYSGAISVIEKNSSGQFQKLEDFPVQPKVHSLAVDTETHRVYVPEQEEKGQGVSRLIIYEPISTSRKKLHEK